MSPVRSVVNLAFFRSPLSRTRALVIVTLVWAAIYLPALGTLEIKGEEGRRILPAVSMLETGDWVLPRIGGEPYLSKPPLLNWLIAAAFQVSGTRGEWAARMPSVLAMLALGLGLAHRGGAWLGPAGGLAAAVMVLTSVGMMEKGRLAEIEALYVACYGLATVDWLASWRAGANPWRLWLVPGVFLGLGLLAKGPLLLVFFYVVALAVLWRAGRWRAQLAHPAMWVGLALAAGMFLAWAAPYWAQAPAGRVGRTWGAQFTGRLQAEEGFRFWSWAQNVPRGLFNFVPWAVGLPWLWRGARPAAPADDAIRRGGRAAVAACFLGVSLIPGGLPRYTLPLLAPAALLLALELFPGGAPEAKPRANWLWRWSPLQLILRAAGLMALITFIYAVAVVPRMLRGEASLRRPSPSPESAVDSPDQKPPRRESLRSLGARVNAAAAAADGGRVYALAPGYQPFLFYLRPSPSYVRDVSELPAPPSPPVPGGPRGGALLLVKEKAFPAASAALRVRGLGAEPVLTLDEKNRGRYRLLRVMGPDTPVP